MPDLSSELKSYEEIRIDGKLYIFKHLNSYDKAKYVNEFRKRCKAQKLENLRTAGATPAEIAVELDAFDDSPPQLWWRWTMQDADAPLVACRLSLAKTYPTTADIGATFGNGNAGEYGTGSATPDDLIGKMDLGFKNVRTVKGADGIDELTGDNEMTELLKALFGKWLLVPKPSDLPDTTSTSTYGDGAAPPNADSPGPTYGTPATKSA